MLQTHVKMQERALLKSLAPIHVIVWMDILEIIVQQVRITKVFTCIHTQVMFSFNVSHNIMLTGNHRTSIQVGVQEFFFLKQQGCQDFITTSSKHIAE